MTLRPYLLLLLAALLAGCDSYKAPTAPTETVLDVSGSWIGSFVIAHCPGAPNCGFVGWSSPPADPFPIELALAQQGTAVTGTMARNLWSPQTVSVSGTFSHGVFSLTGRSSWPYSGGCTVAGEFILKSLTARADPSTRALNGELSFQGVKHLTSCYYALDMEVVAKRLTLLSQ